MIRTSTDTRKETDKLDLSCFHAASERHLRVGGKLSQDHDKRCVCVCVILTKCVREREKMYVTINAVSNLICTVLCMHNGKATKLKGHSTDVSPISL